MAAAAAAAAVVRGMNTEKIIMNTFTPDNVNLIIVKTIWQQKMSAA